MINEIPEWLMELIDKEKKWWERELRIWHGVDSDVAKYNLKNAAERLEEIQKFLSEVK